MNRLFIPKDQFPNISGSDVHYLKDVMRVKPGDAIELFDGTGIIYQAEITKIDKQIVQVKILSSRKTESEPATKITLAQALPKASKMDFVIEKCSELGVAAIIPMLTERTLAKEAKLDRWKRLAKEAAEQSGRGIVPEITELKKFEEVLKLAGDYDLALIPWELETGISLKKAMENSRAQRILLLIGPEGGYSQAEVAQAKAAGFTAITLGKRILRTETAGMATLAAIIYQAENP